MPLPRRILLLTILGHLMWLGAGVRHKFVYGGEWYGWLHGVEGAALVIGAGLAAWGWLLLLRHWEELPRRFVLWGGLVATWMAWLAPPFLSSDVFDYVARGFVAVLGENPYVTSVSDVMAMGGAGAEAMAPFAELAEWPGHVMPYGPLAHGLQVAVAGLGDPWLGAYGWKALAAGAHVGTAALLGRVLGPQALALWLWHPWLLLECVGSGHNDVFIALGLAGMALALVRGRAAGAVFGWTLGALVKHGALVLIPVIALDAFRQRRMGSLLLASAGVLALLAGCWWLLWQGPDGLRWLSGQGAVQNASLANLLLTATGLDAARVLQGIGGLLTALVLGRAAWKARGARSLLGHGAVASIPFVLLVMPNFSPWYHLWWLPAALVTGAAPVHKALTMWALLGPLSYVVLAGTHTFGTAHQAGQVLLAGVVPTLPILMRWKELCDPLPFEPRN